MSEFDLREKMLRLRAYVLANQQRAETLIDDSQQAEDLKTWCMGVRRDCIWTLAYLDDALGIKPPPAKARLQLAAREGQRVQNFEETVPVQQHRDGECSKPRTGV